MYEITVIISYPWLNYVRDYSGFGKLFRVEFSISKKVLPMDNEKQQVLQTKNINYRSSFQSYHKSKFLKKKLMEVFTWCIYSYDSCEAVDHWIVKKDYENELLLG